MVETFLQNEIFSKFILPFLFVFFLVFGVLEKSKLFGSEKKQLNALIAFVIGLIFVAAVSWAQIASNLILFLTIALITMFVGLLLWGFISGEEGFKFSDAPKGLKYFIGIVILIIVLIALVWALGLSGTFFLNIYNFLFGSSWSKNFWTNALFIAVIIIALVLIIGKEKKG
ncbi:MAG: hypothetical protein QXX55_02010 [Candidatus Pacearchaeota archaeon]